MSWLHRGEEANWFRKLTNTDWDDSNTGNSLRQDWSRCVMVIITFRFQQTCSAYRLAAKYRRKEITFSWLLIYLPDNRNNPKSLNIQLANIAVYFHQSTQYGRNASHVTMSAVCDHAALRPRCRFRASALARSALRPCPTACMRECFHRCVRWEDEEVTAGCSVQRCHKFIYVKGKRGGRGREGGLAMCAALLDSSKYLCLAGCGHSFVDIRKLKQRKHACRRSLYEVACLTVGLRCIVLPDNLFLTDIKWPRSTCYAKPQLLWLVMYNLCVFTSIFFIFVFHCTHVRMSYVLNSYLYLLTYLLTDHNGLLSRRSIITKCNSEASWSWRQDGVVQQHCWT